MSMTYGQLEDALQAAIVASLPDDDSETWIYVCDFSDTFVVYCKNYDEYLQDDYTLDGETITLAGEPTTVKPVTTYEPLSRQGRLEVRARGGRGGAGNLEILARNPDLIAERIASQMGKLGRDATSSELVYTPTGQHSYYRDMILRGPGAEGRLTQHAEQMASAATARAERVRRSLVAFEYRVEPNTTPGTGGYGTPPLWLNQLFATANRPGRVLADLIRARFPLPPGVSSVNLPIIGTGTVEDPTPDNTGVPDRDITDSAGSSMVVTLDGQVDVALQLLELSPASAPADWAIFMDLAEATDAQLEAQLLVGSGVGLNLLGVAMVASANNVTYPDASPTGAEMYPFLGNVAAKIGDNRLKPPECWLMRTARWAWLMTQESTSGYPFGITAPMFLGKTDDTPDPIGGLLGWPVFLDDAIPANLAGNPGSFTTGGTQDLVVGLRPSDLILFEGDPHTVVMREPLSGALGARIQMHSYAAAITDRRPAGIGVLGGAGLAVQSGE